MNLLTRMEEIPEGSINGPLYDVIVARSDGVLERVQIAERSRFSAARHASTIVSTHRDQAAKAKVVIATFNASRPLCIAGEECQGPAAFEVVIEDRRGILHTVAVVATSRKSAIEAALQELYIGNPVALRVRYECLTSCSYCGALLFADMRFRPVGNGLKCLDCP